ncbi:HNH endonuclease [Nocardioides panacisoli]|uniref:HNH endonuclease n=1 Tax=Nocardioides panacisoli TaxID=627624 RepID=UPI001C628DE5|nr:HNH endonuclease signature motif containing protein [Nocardioides panacisoli]QYJ04274.1 HNH endonuclease [Nocardioides panacisoli]
MTRQQVGVTTAELAAITGRLVTGGLAGDDADRVDALRALEELKCVVEGRQLRETAAFDASQRDRAAALGVPAERRGRGIGHQVALARRESPHRGQRHTGLARVPDREMPHTRHALVTGAIGEWRATLLARETACLPLDHRREVDRRLAGDRDRLEALSDREVVAEARRLAARLDPASVAQRRRNAEADRHVSLRPAPDTMAWFTALLPVADAVAMYATLRATADHAVGTGLATSRGRAMADTLLERVTGRPAATPVPVTLNLVLTPDALLDDAEGDVVHLDGWGPIPADLARDLTTQAAAPDHGAAALRRLFASPDGRDLVAMESRARCFPHRLAEFIRLRDRTCRTPWCHAPIRHTDHLVPHGDGGRTTAANGQGLCESCNHAKQAPGWTSTLTHPVGHTVTTTTPTGHHYDSQAPPITGPPAPGRVRIELAWTAA